MGRHSMQVVVNGAFRSQRITGQQRYATEIAARLLDIGAKEMRPNKFWSASALMTWFWVVMILPFRSRKSILVSLTARAPFTHSRHVLAVHDLFVLTHPEWYSRQHVLPHRLLFRLQLRFAAAFVAVSEPVAVQLARLKRISHVAVAPNAPSVQFRQSEAAGALEQLGLKSTQYLLTVGSMDPRKNFPRLAQAWQEVVDRTQTKMQLVVVGGSASSFAEQSIDWPPQTVIAGYVTDTDLADLYAKARALIFVSLEEGFGLPLVEAAVAGQREFILSDIEVFRWIAGDHAIYVDARRTESISRALEQMIDHPYTASEPGLDLARFDWEASARVIWDVASSLKVDSAHHA